MQFMMVSESSHHGYVPAMNALLSCESLFFGSGRLMEYLTIEEPIVAAKRAGFVPLPET